MCTQVYYALAHFCLQWVVQYNFRQRLRSKYGLEEEPCSDCCVAFWCDDIRCTPHDTWVHKVHPEGVRTH